ncbi:hypothetical protein ACFL7E_07760 [Thermodesulfobacteriota bacterium]
MKKGKLFVAVAVWIFIFSSASILAAGDLKETKIPDDLTPGLDYLLALVSSDNRDDFDLKRIEKVLDFVLSPKDSNALYHADKKNGAHSAYYEFDIQKDLKNILQYAYNSDIPSFAVMPSAIRISYWSEVNGTKKPLPRLWNHLSNQNFPVFVRGIEHIEITPDQSSGAYYIYDMNKLLVLCEYRGRNLLIQIAKQTDTSDVGRKGVILGPDEDWNYHYSGQKGIPKTGLGWVDSYMYDSFGISIFYEIDENAPLVKYGTFKWLRAGWADVNFVKKRHIYNGHVRFAKSFKTILEHPSLPTAPELTNVFSHLESLSIDDLRERVKPYLNTVENRLSDKKLSEKEFTECLRNGEYLAQLTRREMQAILVLEYMKSVLGRDQRFGG